MLSRLRGRLADMRRRRNLDARWSYACRWADTPALNAPTRGGIRRKAGESDEDFAVRQAKRRSLLTRREAARKALYDAHVAQGATERSRIYWGTWNHLLKSVDQARKAVLRRRKEGLPAEWRRPRWDAPCTIAADRGGFRIDERGRPWWVISTRVSDGWVTMRAKFGRRGRPPIADEVQPRTLQLTLRKSPGRGWVYSVSMAVESDPPEHAGKGLVSLDWGHREHGHPNEHKGIRVFTWLGDDGMNGEILLPIECRKLLDDIDATKTRMDLAFNARRQTLTLKDRNRHRYRSRLMRAGVRGEEEQRWLTWEARYERRLARMRRRIVNLRKETYIKEIRSLRALYSTFAIEDETIAGRTGRGGHRRTDVEEQTRHRKRQNRELSARYEFLQILERSGATILPVISRKSTRECQQCGNEHENGPELYRVCPVTGIVDDKDEAACETILKRAKEALAKQVA
jgi:hypothetical protein